MDHLAWFWHGRSAAIADLSIGAHPERPRLNKRSHSTLFNLGMDGSVPYVLNLAVAPPPPKILKLAAAPCKPTRITFPDELLQVPRATGPSPQKRPRARHASQTGQRKTRRSAKPRQSRPPEAPEAHVLAAVSTTQPDNLSSEVASIDWEEDGVQPMQSFTMGSPFEHERYFEYIDSALSAAIGFYRVTPDLYVVQGWDSKSAKGTVRFL
jgi:hypothetical protein